MYRYISVDGDKWWFSQGIVDSFAKIVLCIYLFIFYLFFFLVTHFSITHLAFVHISGWSSTTLGLMIDWSALASSLACVIISASLLVRNWLALLLSQSSVVICAHKDVRSHWPAGGQLVQRCVPTLSRTCRKPSLVQSFDWFNTQLSLLCGHTGQFHRQ